MRFFCHSRARLTGQFLFLLMALLFSGCSHAQTNSASTVSLPPSVYGTNFTLSVPDVEPGDYSAIFGFVESQATGPGQRLFDIEYAGQLVATNLDVFAAVGRDKPCYFALRLRHGQEPEGGPIAFQFIAVKGQAMINTFELRNASGETVFSFHAIDLVNGDTNATAEPVVPGPVLWTNATLSFETRVKDLISRMSLAEKVSQLRNNASPIWRLGVPAYDYWSECLHGVARAGVATVFPQAIGLSATWDTSLIHQVADTISTEARAKHNLYVQLHDGDSVRYAGLTFWSPNINIFRDPRWGRGQETYGEDPFLTGQMAVAFIRGLQGDDPKYIKVMACAKHFAVHSGPESQRHWFNADPPERDLFETYLPQFEAAVRQGHVGAVMGAYNRLDGEPCNSNPFLLTDLLRKQWGFDGHVVSDCGAINDIYEGHQAAASLAEAAARAIKAGCDLCCGTNYNFLAYDVRMGMVKPEQIDTALEHALMARFRLGVFDPPDLDPYAKIPISENDTPEHEQLALRTAQESIVLLKNDGVLPLQRDKIKRLAVIGENATSLPVLVGNYNGTPARPVTILDGIKAVAGPGIDVEYERGCPLARRFAATETADLPDRSNAVALAKTADVIVYVGGLHPYLEGEEMPVAYEGFWGGDRTKIELPAPQEELLEALRATGKPIVFVNLSGSAVAMPWAVTNIPAILEAWYPGEQGGRAVADVLFGDVNPAGRLPVTFYNATTELPAFEDYSMSNRTYRYFNGTPEFAFGHGLSYTRFEYNNPHLDAATVSPNGTLKLSFSLRNAGSYDGDEVAQVYVQRKGSPDFRAKEALCGFTRVHVSKNETANVSLDIPAERFRIWNTVEKKYVVERGAYELLIGAASDDIRARLPVTVTAEN